MHTSGQQCDRTKDKSLSAHHERPPTPHGNPRASTSKETVSLRRMPPASELAAGALPQPGLAGRPRPLGPPGLALGRDGRWELPHGRSQPLPRGHHIHPHGPAQHLPGPEQPLTSGQAGAGSVAGRGLAISLPVGSGASRACGEQEAVGEKSNHQPERGSTERF